MKSLKHKIYKDTKKVYRYMKPLNINTNNLYSMTAFVKQWVYNNAETYRINPDRVLNITVASHLLLLNKEGV